MVETIESAIQNLSVIKLSYHGFHRLVEPHAYGVNNLGHDVLRCWQVSGGSVSGEPQGWKLLRVSEIASITNSGTSFSGARSGYRKGDKHMVRIHAEL